MKLAVACFVLPADADAQAVKRRVHGILPAALVQVVNSAALKNEALAELIAWQSRSARDAGCLLAKTQEMDFLLRVSGTTQISRALGESGAKSREENVLVLAGDSRDLNARLLRSLGLTRRLSRREPTAEEFDRVERAAMLNAAKA